MTVRQLIELVQQHHPHMGENEILHKANRIIEGVARSNNLFESTLTGTTVANQRYYTLNSKISTIKTVSVDGLEIPRIPEPAIDDSTDESNIIEETN